MLEPREKNPCGGREFSNTGPDVMVRALTSDEMRNMVGPDLRALLELD